MTLADRIVDLLDVHAQENRKERDLKSTFQESGMPLGVRNALGIRLFERSS